MQDNAHGVVVVEEEDNLLKRKFCLETGGTLKKFNDTKGLNNAFSSYTFYNRWNRKTYLLKIDIISMILSNFINVA